MTVIENTLGNIRSRKTHGALVGVPFEWFECSRGRIKKTADDGRELGIAIPGGVNEGDILMEDESVYVVRVLPTDLTEIRFHSAEEAARIGFELGNRHLPLKIEHERILTPHDEPTMRHMLHLGFEARAFTGCFSGFTVCRAHGHSHD